MSRIRPAFAAATAAILSSLLLGCAQASPKARPTSGPDASTSECDSAASTPEASPESPALTTATPWNTCLYGPDPEVLEREAEPAIYAARAEAIAFMHEMAAQLPADTVADVTDRPAGSVSPCGQDEMQWGSNGEIVLKAPVDPARAVVIIGEHWKTKPGYQVIYYRSDYDGRPEVWIKGPKHAGYITDVAPDRTTMSINALSACFKVPTDFIPKEYY